MSYLVNRRDFVLVPALASAALARSSKASHDSLALRGYYFTFMRMPTYGLPEWKQIIQAVGEDGGNMILLWLGGGFHSRKFPITWQYNRALVHESELARNEPDSQVHHLPRAYDDGLPSSAIRLRM